MTYLASLKKHSVYKFISDMVQEVTFCKRMMKKEFNKELVISQKDQKDLEKLTNVGFAVKKYVDYDVRVKGYCNVNGKYKGSVHRHYSINLKLTHQIPIIFHNLRL